MKLFEIYDADTERGPPAHIGKENWDRYKTRTEEPAYGNHYIYKPDIIDVEIGNMIRVKQDPPEYCEFTNAYHYECGQMVVNVDYKNKQVLVKDKMGGTLENTKWYPIEDVLVTWNIGGYERAMKLHKELSGAVEDALAKRTELGID